MYWTTDIDRTKREVTTPADMFNPVDECECGGTYVNSSECILNVTIETYE